MSVFKLVNNFVHFKVCHYLYCVILIGGFNSIVENENVILQIEMESGDKGILFTLCIKFFK